MVKYTGKTILVLFFGILFFLIASPSYGQDIENVFKKDKKILKGDPFKISGSLGLNLRSYNASGIDNRQSPFTWFLSGNTNIQIYQINIPFSILVSAQSKTFAHPFHKEAVQNRFSRFGASPYYKWIKVHGGHRNMKLSPLTVAGHTYLGGGVELTPGKIRFGAFYGKLAKTEPRDLSLQEPNVEVFRRTGWGAKLGYGDQQNFIDLIVFNAKDDDSSLDLFNADTSSIFREENLVLGLNGKATLLKRVDVNLEIASSAFTQNADEGEVQPNQFPHPAFLLESKPSTSFRWAVDASANYRFDRFLLGVGYKRIEPEYRSLGAYFFNNDLENYTVNIGFALFKSKLQINANGGLQRNNLFEQNATQLTRRIGAVNANYAYKAFSFGANYSNYTSDIDFVLNSDLDSLNAVVVTEQGGMNASYTRNGKNDNRHTFTTNFTVSQVSDDVDDLTRSSASKMYNGDLVYVFSPKDKIWKIRGRLNFNQNELSQMLLNRYGVGLGVTRQIIEKKWSIRLDANYYNSQGELIENQTLRLRLGSPITLGGNHRLNLNLLYLNRFSSKNNKPSFSELTGILGYTFNF
jgi:hypothetical protein